MMIIYLLSLNCSSHYVSSSSWPADYDDGYGDDDLDEGDDNADGDNMDTGTGNSGSGVIEEIK